MLTIWVISEQGQTATWPIEAEWTQDAAIKRVTELRTEGRTIPDPMPVRLGSEKWQTTVMNELATWVYFWAKGKGFWDEVAPNVGEKIALMHSELSEALEAARHGNPKSEHIPEYPAIAEELADTIIRIFDFSGAYGVDLDGAFKAKMQFNENRPYKHGKAF